GVGPVDLHVIAGALQGVADEAGELCIARGAEAVAQHEMRPTAGRLTDGGGGHRMAIDENGYAEALASRLQQLGQGRMEGPIQPLDALECSADLQPFAINLLSIGNDPRDRAETSHDAR